MELVVVSLGTDHHRFDRVTDWLEGWVADHAAVRVVFQHGTSRAASGAESHDLLPHPELMELFSEADAVILQGGPGGVMDARSRGIKPIVIPRDPARGEHVDQHQQDFSRHLASRGVATVVGEVNELEQLLAATERGEVDWRIPPEAADAEGVRRIVATLGDPPPPGKNGVRRFVRIWTGRG